MTAPWVDLLCEIVRDVPNVRGAKCVRRTRLMEDPSRVADAIALCHQCGGLRACQEWATRQQRLSGVVGGQLYGTASDEQRGRT